MVIEIEKNALAEIVREAIKEALVDQGPCNECCKVCGLSPKTHSNHHDMLEDFGLETLYENHRFIIGIRDGKKLIVKTGVMVMALAFLGFVGAAIYHHFAESIKMFGVK